MLEGWFGSTAALGATVVATLALNALVVVWAWLAGTSGDERGASDAPARGRGAEASNGGDGKRRRCPACGTENGPYRYCRACVSPLGGPGDGRMPDGGAVGGFAR